MTMQLTGVALLALSTLFLWAARGRRWRSKRRFKAVDYGAMGGDAGDAEFNRRLDDLIIAGRIAEVLGAACLLLVLAIDLALLAVNEPTISQLVWQYAPGWIGLVAMAFLGVHTVVVYGDRPLTHWRALLLVTNAVIWGHLFWH